eukprot:m.183112 g.183112  ORF g.183112 m.183112 type:complete len:95 (-) comp18075_c0_seq3:1478-1762(-)
MAWSKHAELFSLTCSFDLLLEPCLFLQQLVELLAFGAYLRVYNSSHAAAFVTSARLLTLPHPLSLLFNLGLHVEELDVDFEARRGFLSFDGWLL